MRRISLALALIGAVAAAGCSGGNKPSSGTSKGTPGSTFTVEVRNDTYWDQDPSPLTTSMVVRPRGGTVTSVPAGINCGTTATACSFDFPWGTTVTLTATNASGATAWYALAGSCSGSGLSPGTCTLTAPNADQMIVVRFSATAVSHPNFSGPIHATEYGRFASNATGAYQCNTCHGSDLQGLGLAPSCSQCHGWPMAQARKTGLVAAINSVSATTPVAVQFTLTDTAGRFVDVSGLATTNTAWAGQNQPMAVTLSLNYFAVDGAGNVSNYKSATSGNPGTTTATNTITSMTLGGSTAANYPTSTNRYQYPDGFVLKGGVACTLAAPCSCSTASPCQIAGTMGYQGGRECTVAAPCTCTSANPCSAGPVAAAAAGALSLDRTTGVYTFTFPTATVYPDPVAMSSLSNATVWLQAGRQENTAFAFDQKRFTAVNVDYNFATPGITGTVAGARRVTDDASCAKCHDGFKAVTNATGTGWGGFHSGARISGPYCAVCHYDGRGSSQWVGVAVSTATTNSAQTGGAADSAVFVHRLHAAEEMLTRVTDGSTYTVGMQLLADGTKKACAKATTALPNAPCVCTAAEPCIPNAFHGMGVTYPQTPANCRECHPNTTQGNQYRTNPSRAACGACHDGVDFVTGAGHNPAGLHSTPANLAATDAECAGCHLPAYIDGAHNIALPPDTGSLFHVAGGNKRTNAGWIVPAGKLPSGAIQLSALVDEVVRTAAGNPAIRFKLQGQTATVPAWDVVFNTSVTDGVSVQPELITSFVGSVGVYFAWAAPQGLIAAPADFNATASGTVKLLWNGKSSGTKAGTLTGPDANGFYTATITGTTVPATAVMLTGGIGYQYDMPDNQPLTQTDLPAFPVAAAANTAYAGYFTGGLIVPMQNVWRTATGYTARRAIVENSRCNACHAQLGVGPTFHVGQRNDAPTCAFCHTGNRNNAGTSVNSPVMIHAIHGAAVRTTPYWGGMFAEVEYPGSSCTQCHVPGSFDFANAASVAALPNMLFTYSAATVVSSPISAACSACHDSAAATQHMQLTGGMVNGTLIGTPQPGSETCLDCHAAGAVADVNVVHRMVP